MHVDNEIMLLNSCRHCYLSHHHIGGINIINFGIYILLLLFIGYNVVLGLTPKNTQLSIRYTSTYSRVSRLTMSSSSATTKQKSSSSSSSTPEILLLGSCGLDRLLSVDKFPHPDAKIRTTAYHEVGGGNAANTASTMGLLSTSLCFSEPIKFKIKLLGKVGNDMVGSQVKQELESLNVDLSSPLFVTAAGEKDTITTTTGFTTVLVSQDYATRTCIHTPGTCGELTMEEVLATNMDELFENVILFHSDARHTDVALYLAKQAKKRRIPVSLDVEKDRGTSYLDYLLEEADLIFTNSNCIQEYLVKLTKQKCHDNNQKQQTKQKITITKNNNDNIGNNDLESMIYTRSVGPNIYFAHYCNQIENKQVIATHGSMGSLHVQSYNSNNDKVTANTNKEIDYVNVTMNDNRNYKFQIQRTGIVENMNIVDTTGAGDAFIGAYLMCMLYMQQQQQQKSSSSSKFSIMQNVDTIQFALQFGAWVSGQKLQGPGSRSALPTGDIVDSQLGTTMEHVAKSLQNIVTPFNTTTQTKS